MEKLDLVGQAKMLEEYIEKLEANDALNYAKELEERIIRAIEELEEVKRLYDNNYTITDRARDVIGILKGEM